MVLTGAVTSAARLRRRPIRAHGRQAIRPTSSRSCATSGRAFRSAHGIELSNAADSGTGGASPRGDPRSAHHQSDACSTSCAKAPPRRPTRCPKSADAEHSIADDAIYEGGAAAAVLPAAAQSAAEAVVQSGSAGRARSRLRRELNRDAAARAARARTPSDRVERAALPDTAAARDRSVANQHRDAGAEHARRSARPREWTSTTAASARSRPFLPRRLAARASRRSSPWRPRRPSRLSPMATNESATTPAARRPRRRTDQDGGVAAGAAGEVRCLQWIRAAARRPQPSRRQKTRLTSMRETTRKPWRCRRPRSRCQKTSRQDQRRRRSQTRHRSHHRRKPDAATGRGIRRAARAVGSDDRGHRENPLRLRSRLR